MFNKPLKGRALAGDDDVMAKAQRTKNVAPATEDGKPRTRMGSQKIANKLIASHAPTAGIARPLTTGGTHSPTRFCAPDTSKETPKNTAPTNAPISSASTLRVKWRERSRENNDVMRVLGGR